MERVPMADKFSNHSVGLTAPATNAFAITTSNSDDLAHVTRALYVGVTGNIAVVMKNGDSVIFTNVPAGTVLPIRAARVSATGTTAQDMVGLY
jgi:hypothetical protein